MSILVTTSHKFIDDYDDEKYYNLSLESNYVFLEIYSRDNKNNFSKTDSISLPADIFKEIADFFVEDYNKIKRRGY